MFYAKGQYITHWGLTGSGDGQFNYPHGIALGIKGNIFLVDNRNHRIQKFSFDGTFLSAFGEKDLANARAFLDVLMDMVEGAVPDAAQTEEAGAAPEGEESKKK